MPKTTFFNLAETKRQKIEQAAIKEFAAYGFHGARLNNIVAGAKIAKGSFYQYFEDMEDLFFHLINSFSEQKMSYINAKLSKHKEADLFEKIKITQTAGMRYFRSLSEEARLMVDHFPSLMKLDSARLAWFRKEYYEAHYMPLIDEALQKGEIAIDRDFAFVVIANTGRMIRQYVMETLHLKHINEISASDKEVDKAIDLFVDFIKAGLTAKNLKKEK